MSAVFDTCREHANAWHQEGFKHMLEALRRYRHPLPHLSGYESREARLMVAFIEILPDQLYPREIWENCQEELPTAQ